MAGTADPFAGVTMSYEALVEAGRAAAEFAEQYQWGEGDLALQVEHLDGNERPRDPETGAFLAGESALKRYADDIEVNYSTLKEYRRVSLAWPPAKRSARASWTVHQQLAAITDRFDHIRDGMTYREARELSRELRGLNTNASRVGPGWFELLGEVGDTLIKAGKQLAKAEDAIEEPGEELRGKAREYADWADDLAARLRGLS